MVGLLDRAEQRPALTAFVVGFAARLVVVVGLGLTGSHLPDESTFWGMAGDLLAGSTEGAGDRWHVIYSEVPFFVWPLAGIRWVAGPTVLAPRLTIAIAGATTAALTAHGTARATGGRSRAALVAGLLVALWPSQVLYSSAVLKDAVVWLALSATFAATSHAVEVPGRRAGGTAFVVGATAVLLLSGTRASTGVVAAIALVAALAVLPGPRRWRLLLGASAVLVLVVAPWVTGKGPAGSEVFAASTEAATARATEGADACTTVRSVGQTRQLDRMLVDLPRGVSLVWLEPYVWEEVCQPAGQIAKVEVVAWYGLLVAAGLAVLRRQVAWRALVFPMVCLAGLTAAGALAEVNVGTAFRHRGALFWAVAALAGTAVAGRRQGQSQLPRGPMGPG